MARAKTRWIAAGIVFVAYLVATYIAIARAESERLPVALVQIVAWAVLVALLSGRDRLQWLLWLITSALVVLWALTALPYVLLIVGYFAAFVDVTLYRNRGRERSGSDA